MKKSALFLLFSIATHLIFTQSFQEICESSNTNGTVVDYQYFGDTLYATGFFNIICGESTGYLVNWDNNEWRPATIGITDPGHALEVINDQLYIAKYEESIDSNWVYFYDNTSLEKLGAGVYLTTATGFSELPNIYDIIDYDGRIVACGEFDRVGQESISGIMQWDGSNWISLGTGLSGNIPNTAPVMFPHQMMVHNSELYVVGNFRNAGSEIVNGVAKWNGTSWTNMGDGFDNTIYSITVFNDEIIAGGSFTESGETAINRIAKWDGTEWLPLDFGFTSSSVNDFIFVHTLKVIDDLLYIGGGLKEITYSDNTTEVCNGIVSYDGSTLNTFEGGVPNNDIEAIIKVDDHQLLIGGGVFGSGYTGITDINTKAEQVHLEVIVDVFPNPFENTINITTAFDFDTYVLLDTKGKILYEGKYSNQLTLDLTSGVYFLRLVRGNAYTTQKIIKL